MNHSSFTENQCSGVQRELFTRAEQEGFNAECLLVVLMTVGAGADQQQELSHSEICVNRS